MVKVAGVKFRDAGKVYYFAPGDIEGLTEGREVIVETSRGMEFGTVALSPCDIDESEILDELKNIVRIATDEDIALNREHREKKEEALRLCREKIIKHGLEMKLIDVEFTFDNNKIIFYFTADGRVDFRELVKDLAGIFRMRIELRQIGVRDEAKIIGGCGICGCSLCCASWMQEFKPVSIKMAKNQNLSLNPNKISGICGRLVCCLRYENEAYTMLRQGMPEVGDLVDTADGRGRVEDVNLLQSRIRVKLFTGEKDEDGKELLSANLYNYEIGEFDRPDSNKKRNYKPRRKEEEEQ
jgi:cell fate regulator YaaT (PSP1 superfamily)